MAITASTPAAELLEEARRLEELALHAAACLDSGGFGRGLAFGYRSAARRLRSLAAQWDDAGDLREWYSDLGARALCAEARTRNTERTDTRTTLTAA